MFEWINEKARKVRDWAEEHPILAATGATVVVVGTGGIIYLVYQTLRRDEMRPTMPDLNRPEHEDDKDWLKASTSNRFADPVGLEQEMEPIGNSVGADLLDNVENYTYRLGPRREHLRNIAPKNASEKARALAALSDIDLPEHYTLVRSSNPRIRCAASDPRAVTMIPLGGEREANPLDLWDENEIVIELIDKMETLDSEVFETLYNRLDVDHQIEVDESILKFANNAIGCDYWDSDN